MYAQQLLHKVRHFFVPPFCRFCKRFLSDDLVFCVHCFDLIEPLVTTMVQITRTVDMKVFSIGAYHFPLKLLILAKSWSDRTAARQLGMLSWSMTDLKFHQFDVIVPVPLYWSRRSQRGFNQAEIMARTISLLSSKPVLNLVKRRKATPFQSLLPAAQRQLNVEDAFQLNEQYISECAGKNILFVDDLMTTGATLHAMGKIVLPLNPASLSAMVGARVI